MYLFFFLETGNLIAKLYLTEKKTANHLKSYGKLEKCDFVGIIFLLRHDEYILCHLLVLFCFFISTVSRIKGKNSKLVLQEFRLYF